MRTLGILCAALSAVLAASPAAAATLYGVTGDGGSPAETLYTLDQTNASSTFVTTLGNGTDGEVIAYNPDDGLIYHASGIDTQNTDEILETVHPNSLVVTNVPLSGVDYQEVRGFTYDDVNDILLAADQSNTLFQITTAGVVSTIGAMDHQSKGLAFSGGVLYSVSRDDDLLRTINPATGATLTSVTISLTGDNVNGATGLAAHPGTGQLFALLKLDFQSGRELVTLNAGTGVATSIGDTGRSFAGITFVPEPSTGLLFAFGLAGLGLHRRAARS